MKSKKRKRMWVISAIAILVIGSAAAWTFLTAGRRYRDRKHRSNDKHFKSGERFPHSFDNRDGDACGWYQMDLSFATSGTVAEVNVAVGDVVSTGDVLAVLDDLDALQVEIEENNWNWMQRRKPYRTCTITAPSTWLKRSLHWRRLKKPMQMLRKMS